MGSQIVGVYKETAPGERRVALVPEAVGQVRALSLDVLVESGAGNAAWFPDDSYLTAGARIVSRAELFDTADILVGVQPPNPPLTHSFRKGQALVGFLQPWLIPLVIRRWAEQGLTTISLDLLPRTRTDGGPLDALTPQAQLGGYQAVLVAAGALSRCVTTLTTAAGAGEPAEVLVLGAGAAGLEAIATARRLGAAVYAYDVRPRTRGEVAALGATFLDLADTPTGPDEPAPADRTTDYHSLPDTLTATIARFDIVITTVGLPGQRPPRLVTARAIRAMRPGSAIVDTTVSPLGGNVELAEPDTTTLVAPGVTIVGDSNLASKVPTSASIAYAGNITALLARMTRDGALVIDLTDAIQAAMVVSHRRMVLNDAVLRLINETTALAGMP